MYFSIFLVIGELKPLPHLDANMLAKIVSSFRTTKSRRL